MTFSITFRSVEYSGLRQRTARRIPTTATVCSVIVLRGWKTGLLVQASYYSTQSAERNTRLELSRRSSGDVANLAGTYRPETVQTYCNEVVMVA
jgi:hypothetical protein